MNEKIQQAAKALIQAASLGNLEAAQLLEQIMAMAQAISQEMQAMQSALKEAQLPKIAKLGTKLEYINKLKGICPEGTERVYLAKGGCICKKVKSAEPGGNLQKKAKMPTKYDEKKHDRLAVGEAMGKNTKAQQDSLQHYRKLYNKQSDTAKYNMGDQKAGYNLKNKKKACGGLIKKINNS